MSNQLKSISQLKAGLVNDELLSFEFVEGIFSFDELKQILGKRDFAKFLFEHLKENGVQINSSVKNGVQVISPLKTVNGEIVKFWVDENGNLVDVTKFRPAQLY